MHAHTQHGPQEANQGCGGLASLPMVLVVREMEFHLHAPDANDVFQRLRQRARMLPLSVTRQRERHQLESVTDTNSRLFPTSRPFSHLHFSCGTPAAERPHVDLLWCETSRETADLALCLQPPAAEFFEGGCFVRSSSHVCLMLHHKGTICRTA